MLSPRIQRLNKKLSKNQAYLKLKGAVKAAYPWSVLHALFFSLRREIVKHKLRRLGKSKLPILVGPWISEVGFELIYWVPFLAWAFERYRIDPSRIYVVSRGGVGSWYADVGKHYAELYDFTSQSEFKDHLLERKDLLATQKHIMFSDWDKNVLAKVTASMNLGRTAYLHPKEMFQVFQEIWADGASRNAYGLLRHRRFRSDAYIDVSRYSLPEKYILCRFYSSKCFQIDDDARLKIKSLLARLSRSHHVVVVSPGFDLDDHSDVDVKAENVTVIDSLPLNENLGIQTALVANASLFVTTYGGLSYLGILTGVPTIALHTNGRFLASHLDTALRAARGLNQSRGDGEGYAEYAVLGLDAIHQFNENLGVA